MRILLCSHVFSPSVGGTEKMSEILAGGFSARGHEVVVATQTPNSGSDAHPYGVVRQPSTGRLRSLIRWSDVVFHNNISLRMAPMLFLSRRPWVVAHHTWIRRPDGHLGVQDRLKMIALRFARQQIANSTAISRHAGGRATVIGNAYDDALFRLQEGNGRDQDFMFVGRLVSDKGADLAILALSALVAEGISASLTVVGDGPERGNLEAMSRNLNLEGNIRFKGALHGENLVSELNRHKALLVPSRWDEPFGIVALEGIACGCVVVGSDGGGLRDAIGPCGLTYPNLDVSALAAAMKRLHCSAELRHQLLSDAPAHLAKHATDRVVESYLRVLEEATR